MNFIVQQTEDFAKWRAGIQDLRAATAVRRRLERAQAGNLGGVKSTQASDIRKARSLAKEI